MAHGMKSPQRPFGAIFGQLAPVAIGIGALAAALAGWITLTTALAMFGVCLLGSIILTAWSMRSYKCPTCGAKLLPPKGWWRRFPGEPILMRCVRCGTDRDFGLRGQTD